METKKIMEGRKVLSLLLLSVFLFSVLSIFSISPVSALSNNLTINLTGLSMGGNVLETAFFVNITFTQKAGDGNDAIATYSPLVNLTYYLRSALTSNGSDGSWVKIGVNNSVNFTSKTTTIRFDFTQGNPMVEDSSDYILNVTAHNTTAGEYLNSTLYSINLTVDNSVPSAPTSLNLTGTTQLTTINFSSSIADQNATMCYLNFTGSTNPGSPSYTASYSGSSCSFQLTSIPEQSYQYYFTASDGLNATVSSIGTVTVDQKTSAGKTVVLAQQQGVKSEGGALLSVASGNSPSDIFSRFINWIKNLFN